MPCVPRRFQAVYYVYHVVNTFEIENLSVEQFALLFLKTFCLDSLEINRTFQQRARSSMQPPSIKDLPEEWFILQQSPQIVESKSSAVAKNEGRRVRGEK